jgi:hypothetical protein
MCSALGRRQLCLDTVPLPVTWIGKANIPDLVVHGDLLKAITIIRIRIED